MRPFRRVLVGFCALALVVPLPARAGHPPECPTGEWRATWLLRFRSCPIGFYGLPITFSGDSEATSGAWVHVWITVSTPNGDEVLGECEDTGTTYAFCDGDVGSIGRAIDLFVLTEVTITCWVEGKTGGYFGCGSGASGA